MRRVKMRCDEFIKRSILDYRRMMFLQFTSGTRLAELDSEQPYFRTHGILVCLLNLGPLIRFYTFSSIGPQRYRQLPCAHLTESTLSHLQIIRIRVTFTCQKPKKTKMANGLVQLIAGPSGVSMNTNLTFHRSGTGPAGRRAGRVPSLPMRAIHPPRQPAIPDGGRSLKK